MPNTKRNKKVYIDLLGTRETKISRPQDVKKINQIFLNYIGITIVIIWLYILVVYMWKAMSTSPISALCRALS